MNNDVPDNDGCVRYYDGDYPSLEIGTPYAGAADHLVRLGILHDVDHYRRLAADIGGPVLEIGCGTGRLTVPLARAGHRVTAVDVSAGMLARLHDRLAAEPEEVRARVRVVQQDAAALDLAERAHRLAIIPFNVLMLIPDFQAERATLRSAAAHLAAGGVLALDVMNPLTQSLAGERAPAAVSARINPATGNSYVKNSLCSRLDGDQKQRLYGWYDELLPDGSVEVTRFSFHWRMIFRWELELMLNEAGFTVETVAADFEGESWTVDARRIVVTARKG